MLTLATPVRADEAPRLALSQGLQLQLEQPLGGGASPRLLLRRGRVGLTLQGLAWLQAGVEASFDRVTLLPTSGEAVAPPRLHEASATLAVLPQRLWLSVGFFRPQLGRESLTSGFAVDSLEKALTQGPLRAYLTGRSSGRAPGLNVGGMARGEGWGLRSDVGLVLHRPDAQGQRRPLLLLARSALSLGAPEAEGYALGLPMNTFSRRPGLTLALQGSTEAGGDAFSLGADALMQLHPLVLSAEAHAVAMPTGHLLLAHARAGVNLDGPGATVLEPYVLVARAVGEVPEATNSLQLDAGLSWYLSRHALRATLGGSWRPAAPGLSAPGGEVALSLQHRR